MKNSDLIKDIRSRLDFSQTEPAETMATGCLVLSLHLVSF